MSRLGKKPILIPEGVEVKIESEQIKVKGPRGELVRDFDNSIIKIFIEDNNIKLEPKKETPQAMALWGTYASHIKNMVDGVIKGFSKNLIIEGVGFKVLLESPSGSEAKKELVLNLGFSHPIKVSIPDDIDLRVEKNKIEVSGIDKEKVGIMAAKIREFKKPEPYKGKGIRYENEVVRRKAGKKAVGVM